MTPRQAAEYRDELARHRIERREAELDTIRTAEIARPKRAYRRRRRQEDTLPPRSEPLQARTPAERQLADRLLPHVCPESVIDRDQHALGVARMLLNIGVRKAA